MKKLIASLLAATMLAGAASAQVLGSYPYTLTNGSLADANQVMSNFNYVTTQVNANTCTLSGCTFTGPVYGTTLSLSSTLGVTGATTLSSGLSGTTGSFTGNVTAGGFIATANGANITGGASVAGGLTVSSGALAVTNAATVGGTLGVTGAATIGGTLGVTGLATGTQFVATAPGSNGQFAATNGTTGVWFRNDGTNFNILKNGSSATAYDTYRPLVVNLTNGAVFLDSTGAGGTSVGGALGVTGITTLTGNVGIGAAPSIANLDVSGTNIAIRNSNGPVLNMRTATAAGGGAAIESSFSTGGYGPLTFATSGTTQLSIAASGAATFTNSVAASSFSGAGTGLTGTAAGLSIGGNAATATTATNQSGGTISATSGTVSGALSAGSFSGTALASAAQTLTGSSTTQAITPAGFAGNSSFAVNGYYKLPGGLILQWGQATPVSTTVAVTWPVACPANIFNVQTTANYGGTAPATAVFSQTLSGATLYVATAAVPIFYTVVCN